MDFGDESVNKNTLSYLVRGGMSAKLIDNSGRTKTKSKQLNNCFPRYKKAQK